MISKPIDQIRKSDIEALVENATRESATLEYKQAAPGTNESDRREFLADVSSFANFRGGDLIYGIKERQDETGKNTGEAGQILPLQGMTADQMKLRIEQLIQDGITPRMRCQLSEITGFGDDERGFIIIIRIPKSLSAPHMVSFQQSSKFYSRNSSGKFILDVQQIRDAFLATESQAERIRNFRLDRIGRILADDTPVQLSSPQRFVLHVIPIGSFLNRERLDLSASYHTIRNSFIPMSGLTGSDRFNLDGLLHLHQRASGPGHGYCQLYFDGTVEVVISDNFVIRGQQQEIQLADGGIDANSMESKIIESIRGFRAGFDVLQVQGPYAVTVSILGCKGYWQEGYSDYPVEHTLESDLINLREVVLDDLNNNLEAKLRPLFDQFWNAFGYHGSHSYDPQGNWHRRSS